MIYQDDKRIAELNKKKKDFISIRYNWNLNYDDLESKMNEIYTYIGENFNENEIMSYKIQKIIYEIEMSLGCVFLPSINLKPMYNSDITPSLPERINNSDDASQVLDYIVHYTRKYMKEKLLIDLENSVLSRKVHYCK